MQRCEGPHRRAEIGTNDVKKVFFEFERRAVENYVRLGGISAGNTVETIVGLWAYTSGHAATSSTSGHYSRRSAPARLGPPLRRISSPTNRRRRKRCRNSGVGHDGAFVHPPDDPAPGSSLAALLVCPIQPRLRHRNDAEVHRASVFREHG